MWSLIFKSAIGALVVLLIALLSRSKSFYIAGLVPLFPAFALIAHVIVQQAQGSEALRKTALFGLWSLIPYAVYLLLVFSGNENVAVGLPQPGNAGLVCGGGLYGWRARLA